jgi:AcrR family transcriptional regulator
MSDSDPVDLDDRVLSAAIRVFASEATSRVTLKRVALEADVPSELVTERWSSTTELLGAAVERLTDDLAAAATCETVPTRGSELTDQQGALLDQAVQLVARALLDQIDPIQLKGRFPMLDQLIGQFVDDGADLRTARYRAFQLMVVEFGVRLFSSSLLVACGLQDESPAQVRSEIDSLEDLVAIRSAHPADQVA